MSHPVCAVVGVGPGNGAAIARRFSDAGYKVALLARTPHFSSTLAKELNGAIAVTCDVSSEADVQAAFAQVRKRLGDVTVLVYNAGSGSWGTIEDITASTFEENWKVNALGSFLAAQQVIPAMKKSGLGSIVFIGATASRRGGAKTAAFAPAKAAQRALAESMARHLWPLGIHVSLLIIDGVVDLPSTRERMPGKSDTFFIKPAAIAAAVYHLCTQDRSAWSFEIEARPFGETW
jgi:NAD(P)-dependent dehydrogenase (short-subunit alcohol dehydrogenase family)